MAKLKTKARTEKKVKDANEENGTKLTAKALEQAAQALERGEVGIKELGVRLGFRSGAPLRAALREMLGEEKYAEVIAAGRAVRGIPAIAAPKAPKAPKTSAKKKNPKSDTRRFIWEEGDVRIVKKAAVEAPKVAKKSGEEVR